MINKEGKPISAHTFNTSDETSSLETQLGPKLSQKEVWSLPVL